MLTWIPLLEVISMMEIIHFLKNNNNNNNLTQLKMSISKKIFFPLKKGLDSRIK